MKQSAFCAKIGVEFIIIRKYAHSIGREVLMRYSRHNKIIELIENNEIDTQEKLAALLKECGFEVTQATLS